MQKNTCIIFIHSINEFHLSKKLCCTNIMFAQHNTKFAHTLQLNYIKSVIYLVSLGNLAHFYLVIWHTITIIPPYIAHPTLRQKIHLSQKFQIVLPSFLSVAFFAIIRIILFPQMLMKGFPNAPKRTCHNSFYNIPCFHALQCYPHCFLQNFALLR